MFLLISKWSTVTHRKIGCVNVKWFFRELGTSFKAVEKGCFMHGLKEKALVYLFAEHRFVKQDIFKVD